MGGDNGNAFVDKIFEEFLSEEFLSEEFLSEDTVAATDTLQKIKTEF